jgi:hypothetical protein
MKKEVFGFSRKELLIFILVITSTLVLIIYSSVKLIHKFHQQDNITYSEVQNYSKDISYLNDLSIYAVNIQRNSSNVLLYNTNPKEILDLKDKIQKSRDSLLLKLNKIENESVLEEQERTKILKSGLNYLNINTSFIQMINDTINIDKLTAYNLDKMRPAIREFSDLNRANTQLLTEKIRNATSKPISIFNQLEFWLLLIGLSPYLYFLYRVTAIIARMVFWELFP